MSIDEKLRNMKPSDTPLLVVGYILLGMMLLLGLPAQAEDNEVLIDQAGDNVIIEGNQEGYDNTGWGDLEGYINYCVDTYAVPPTMVRFIPPAVTASDYDSVEEYQMELQRRAQVSNIKFFLHDVSWTYTGGFYWLGLQFYNVGRIQQSSTHVMLDPLISGFEYPYVNLEVAAGNQLSESMETTHYSVMDKEGNTIPITTDDGKEMRYNYEAFENMYAREDIYPTAELWSGHSRPSGPLSLGERYGQGQSAMVDPITGMRRR